MGNEIALVTASFEELPGTYRWLVWADGTLEFKELGFIEALAETSSDVIVIPHPERHSAEEEYAFVKTEIAKGNPYLEVRYENEKMDEQMAWLRRKGMNTTDGLFCGTFWMLKQSPRVEQCWNEWWDHNLRFGMMDQLSMPGLLQAHRLNVEQLRVRLWDNEHFSYVPHVAECTG